MRITDWQVDLVRSFLRQDDQKLRSMITSLPRSYEVDGTGLLFRAAFVGAVRRRFTGGTRADVVRFVAHARVRRGRNAPPIDPAAAETLIVAALTGARTDELTELQRAQQIILLSELVEDDDPTDGQLEQYLAEARAYAERLAAAL